MSKDVEIRVNSGQGSDGTAVEGNVNSHKLLYFFRSMIKVILGEVGLRTLPIIQRRRISNPGFLVPVLGPTTRKCFFRNLNPAPVLAIIFEKVAMSDWLAPVTPALASPADVDDVVAAERAALIDIDASRVGSGNVVVGTAVDMSRVELYHGFEIVRGFSRYLDRVGESTQVLRVVACAIKDGLSSVEPVTVATEACVEGKLECAG